MSYELLNFAHLVDLALIAGGLIGVWFSDLRSRTRPSTLKRTGVFCVEKTGREPSIPGGPNDHARTAARLPPARLRRAALRRGRTGNCASCKAARPTGGRGRHLLPEPRLPTPLHGRAHRAAGALGRRARQS